MILFIGQVARDQVEREAFQEIDFCRMFGPMAKWVAEIDDAARIPEYVSQAFHRAVNGRPGPVVLALPEDMLVERVAVAAADVHLHLSALEPSGMNELFGMPYGTVPVTYAAGGAVRQRVQARRVLRSWDRPPASHCAHRWWPGRRR